jgi:Zn-dependent protease with chaperone function
LLVIFVGRHWLVGLANATVPWLAGLALLWLAARLWPLRLFPLLTLRLRRLIYLVSLFKGAMYLVVGDNLDVKWSYPIGIGFQFPPPDRIDLLEWRGHFSIWHPTSATPMVTLVLLSLAFVLFAVRASRVTAANHALGTLDKLFGGSDPRMDKALSRAAAALKISSKATLPRILFVEVECATPLLLGIRNPRLLISPRLAAILTDDELEMAIRHELAHFKRRDHWWRWIQLWIEDVGRVIFVSGKLGARSVEIEELLCDRLAVMTPADASNLAKAIAKAANLLEEEEPPTSPKIPPSARLGLENSVVPSLLGRHQIALSEAASLKRRIRELLVFSQELDNEQSKAQSPPVMRRGLIQLRAVVELPFFLLVALLLFGVLYARYHLLLNLH